jgi:hypothetical protein
MSFFIPCLAAIRTNTVNGSTQPLDHVIARALPGAETRDHARLEAASHPESPELTDREVFVRTSVREPALSAASQAGMVTTTASLLHVVVTAHASESRCCCPATHTRSSRRSSMLG